MKLQRIIRKVRAADRVELSFRLQRQLRIWRDRYALSLPAAGGSGKVLEGRRFYFDKEQRAELAAVSMVSEEMAETIAVARRIVAGEIPLFGQFYACPDGIDWHKDPRSDHRWPLSHWSRIQLVDQAGSTDPKFVWELNRHQFLLWPAMAWAVTGEECFAEYVVSTLQSWIVQNPAEQGIHWTESLELGTRLLCWAWLLQLLEGAAALTEAARTEISHSMQAQAWHLDRYLSFYVSPNTHLTGETLGLFVAALLYDFGTVGERWQASARTTLEQELISQTGRDGVHRELSSGYQRYTLDYALLYLLLCRRNGLEVSPEFSMAVEKMCDFCLAAERPDGSVPLLGDNDGGSALPLAVPGAFSWKESLAVAALLFERGDFKQRAGALPWQVCWLLGEDCRDRWQVLEAETPQQRSSNFAEAHYLTWRSDWSPQADWLLLDGGKMGFLSAGHTHADYLHFELALAGRPVVVDPGTSSYHDPQWRQRERTTAWHNCVTVDGCSQVEPAGSFLWQQIPGPGRSGLWQGAEGEVVLAAEHRLYAGVVHRRWLLPLFSGAVLLVDQLCCDKAHDFSSHFHFLAGTELRESGRGFLLNDGSQSVCAVTPLCAGGEGVLSSGTVAPTYGERCAAPILTLNQRRAATFFTATLFATEQGEVGEGLEITLVERVLRGGEVASVTVDDQELAAEFVVDLQQDGMHRVWLLQTAGEFPFLSQVSGKHVTYQLTGLE